MKLRIVLSLFCLALATVAVRAEEKQAKPAVSVVLLENRSIARGLSFTGRVVAINKVDIRARISGFLLERHFTEGQDVKAGDLLFTIEPDTYQAQVKQKEADLAAAKAKAENASVQFERAQQLLPNQTISQANYDDRQARKLTSDAEVLQAEAALMEAKINLGYTRVVAPVDGRIGIASYQRGALVGPDSGPLATVVSQDPIYVTFPVSQRQMLDVRQQVQQRAGGDGGTAVVRLQLSDNSQYPTPGELNFSDVTVDRSTDTLLLRAVFPNPERVLVDGQYVRLRVEDAQPQQALLVPQRAILNDQGGSYVFVVAADGKAQTKRVKRGALEGSDVVIVDGLQVGDRVVVDGVQKVRQGMEVDAAPAVDQAAKG
jgi:membrane fusion protein (multidrug efflux system)